MNKNEKCIICKAKMGHLFAYRDYHYYRCPNCGQVSTYPLPSQRTIEDHYRLKFNQGNYLLLREYSEQYKKVYRQFLRLLKSRLGLNGKELAGATALDVGCFTGDFSGLLVSEGTDAYGLELQDEAVAIAAKTLPGRIFKADVMSDQFPQKDFDIITLFGIIEHVTDPRKLVGRSAKLLKKGGTLMLQTPNSGSAFAKTMAKYWPPYSPVEHIHLFTPKSLRLLLEQEGFTKIVVKAHVKPLPLGYVFRMLQNFGPEFYRLIKPFKPVVDKSPKNISFPFYVGEMIIVAEKQ